MVSFSVLPVTNESFEIRAIACALMLAIWGKFEKILHQESCHHFNAAKCTELFKYYFKCHHDYGSGISIILPQKTVVSCTKRIRTLARCALVVHLLARTWIKRDCCPNRWEWLVIAKQKWNSQTACHKCDTNSSGKCARLGLNYFATDVPWNCNCQHGVFRSNIYPSLDHCAHHPRCIVQSLTARGIIGSERPFGSDI